MIKSTLRFLLLCFLGFSFYNCEDPVTLDSRFVEPQLVVEAWLNNISEPQAILLSESQDYYDNRLPTPVTDAQVIVCQTEDQQPTPNCFVFEHEGEGRYVWEPSVPGETLGEVDMEFGLGIQRGDKQYASTTTMNRTATIDSISFQFEEESLGLDEGLYAQLYARDPVGTGDAYLIRTTFNDTLLLNPSELNIAYDATFSPGSGTDGIAFIFPIRFAINKQDEDGGFIPLEEGDHIAVEVISLSDEAYLFLRIVSEQINNGGSGLFDLPVTNSPGNIFEIESQEAILGFFNVAATARAERTVE
ncbi:DUF4249 domain-containing protein [Neolewinella aurantiaca]|uniref:DUF4249 domain-containing protein n=1 Tax=Neolewinella aurantiaca TaxID=2602767 RepID=A0A5C7FHF4_9BACT|nr:DUF4249 domain-containing protein [Neolewinella aurantiaca]TXF89207.1 DUF4249 domain-containing protein [Neolewinella aurantiaca]